MSVPDAAYIEIVEKRRKPASENPTGGETIIVPNEVRINGVPLLTPRDSPVTVHEVTASGDEAVQVTLTLFARRVEFKSEDPA